jgi:hypothetical protein
MNLDFQDGCVPATACPNVWMFLVVPIPMFPRRRWLANPFSIRFPRVGAAARAAGGMTDYGEYPHQVP